MQKFDFSGYKIPPERVGLDDYEAKTRDGSVYHPHAGESVWLSPDGLSVEATQKISHFYSLAQKAEVAKRGDGARRPKKQKGDAIEGLDDAFDAFCAVCCDQIIAWDITDNSGTQYDQPDDVEAVKRIPSPLLMHLLNVIQGGETEGKETPGEAGSPDGSSTTPGSGKTARAS